MEKKNIFTNQSDYFSTIISHQDFFTRNQDDYLHNSNNFVFLLKKRGTTDFLINLDDNGIYLFSNFKEEDNKNDKTNSTGATSPNISMELNNEEENFFTVLQPKLI